MTPPIRSIQQQLRAEDERLSRRIRRWTVLPAALGLVVVALSFASVRYATSRTQTATTRLRVAKESVAVLDREIAAKGPQILALQQVIARSGTITAQTCGEAVTRTALEQAVGETPGAMAVVPIVYIQFRGGVARSVLEALRSELNEGGYSAPGTERIARDFTSGVYFFHENDRGLAQGVASRSEAFLRERGCAVTLPLKHVPSFASTSKAHQVELWVNTNCPGVR